MAERKGHYVQNGDVQEWKWDEDDKAPKAVAGYALPEPDFDPTTAPHPDDLVPEPAVEPEPEPPLKKTAKK